MKMRILFTLITGFSLQALSLNAQQQDTLNANTPVSQDTSITPQNAPPPVDLSQVGAADSGKAQAPDSTAKLVVDSAVKITDTSVVIDTAGKVEVGTEQAAVNQQQLNGVVYEKDGTTTLPGATVQWLGNPVSTQTDVDGKFAIEYRKEGGTLSVSSVGFSTQKIKVEPGQNDLKITMGLNAGTKIDEVVITALGAQRNTRSLGYAVQQLDGREIQEAKEVNYINALQGKLAGVQINGNAGSMGGSAKVVVRGIKSISGDNNAMFIVDGVPMANMNLNAAGQGTGGGGFDYGNPAQLINPNDVENIAVLKGAAATALYGSRGQNGVIYITTKSGKGAGKLTVNYDFNLQLDKVSLLPSYQNQYGGGSGDFTKLYANEHPEGFGPGGGTYNDNDGKGSYDLLPQYATDESWGPRLDGRLVRHYWSWDPGKGNPNFGQSAPWSPQPDNVRDFFKTGVTVANNVSISSGNEKGTIRFSLGQTHQDFIYPGSKLDRVFFGLNTTYNFTDRLSFSGGVNYIMDKSKDRPGTGFNGFNPMLQFVMYGQRQLDNNYLKNYKYADGSEQTWNRSAWNNPMPVSAENPYWNQYESYNTDRNDRYFGNVGLSYRITDWLTADARVFSDFLDHIDETRSARDYFVGGYGRRTINYNENNYQATLNINKNFLGDRLSLEAIVGGNILNVRSQTETGTTNGGLMSPGVYVLQNSVLPATLNNAYGNYQTNSLFATATLGWEKMLYLTLTGRNDWASPLKQTGNYSFFYPSVGGAFVFSELIPKNKWMTFGKARLSYAQVGNITTPYQVARNFDFGTPFASGSTSYPLLTTPDQLYNAQLKPERTSEVEAGLDLRFLNDRLSLSVTYYDRQTRNQIWVVALPPEIGYGSKIVNGGNVQNRGIELSLNATPLVLGDFRWETGVNFSRNKNKVLDLNTNDGSIGGIETFIIGTERRTQKVSIVAMKGMSLGTIIGTDYVLDANGNRKVLPDGSYDVTSKPVVIGDANPDFIGGFSNTFSYKGIYLSGLIDFQKGGDFFSYTNLYGNKSGLLEETAADGIRENGVINPGVKADGSPNDKVISARDHFNVDGGNRISKANLYDGSFIYLRELRLGWNLPQKWLGKTKMQSARLSLVGRNLWLIHSNAPNVDPSFINNSIGNTPGLEGGALPPVRSYGVNLNITF
ncbi:SusC/RagA family TonB-linked outer membrane protein [Taibaiella koreensis]|uniref:SusC/RagA family TonB-linked outer membrane protein n=1 Tax=Taibaiella koreensis TaxID=1268548 RepID=UPI000E59BC32|nr:SusC/RagA family TonB-linked outer membrane protein [Taibaiella koreensis]